MAVVVRAPRRGQQRVEPGRRVERRGVERAGLGEILARLQALVAVTQPPRTVIDETGITIGRVAQREQRGRGIGIMGLHRQPRLKDRPVRGRDQGKLTGRGGGVVRPQQAIHPRVLIRQWDRAGEAGEQPAFVIRVQRAASPGASRGGLRIGRATECHQRLRLPQIAGGGQRRQAGEIGDDLRRRLAVGNQRAFRRAAQRIFAGPAGVGDEEARIIAEREAVALAQPVPGNDCLAKRIIDRLCGWRGRRGRCWSGGQIQPGAIPVSLRRAQVNRHRRGNCDRGSQQD